MNKNIWRYLLGKDWESKPYLLYGVGSPLFSRSFFSLANWKEDLGQIWNDSFVIHWNRWIGCRLGACKFHGTAFGLVEKADQYVYCLACSRHSSDNDDDKCKLLPERCIKRGRELIESERKLNLAQYLLKNREKNPYVQDKVLPWPGAYDGSTFIGDKSEKLKIPFKKEYLDSGKLSEHHFESQIKFGDFDVRDISETSSWKLFNYLHPLNTGGFIGNQDSLDAARQQYQQMMEQKYREVFGQSYYSSANQSSQSDQPVDSSSNVNPAGVKNKYDPSYIPLTHNFSIRKDMDNVSDTLNAIRRFSNVKIKNIQISLKVQYHWSLKMWGDQNAEFEGVDVIGNNITDLHVFIEIESEEMKDIPLLVPVPLLARY